MHRTSINAPWATIEKCEDGHVRYIPPSDFLAPLEAKLLAECFLEEIQNNVGTFHASLVAVAHHRKVKEITFEVCPDRRACMLGEEQNFYDFCGLHMIFNALFRDAEDYDEMHEHADLSFDTATCRITVRVATKGMIEYVLASLWHLGIDYPQCFTVE